MKIKLAGLSHTSWQEQLGILESDALCDEDAWLDEIFEAMDEGGGTSSAPPVSAQRVATPMPNFQRYGTAPKTAAVSRLDEDFARMQAHARNVMANLGNLR
jgi:hypothetical protein